MSEEIHLTKENRISLLRVAVNEGIDFEDLVSLSVLNLILNHTDNNKQKVSAPQLIAKWKAAKQKNPSINFLEFAESLN